MNILVVGGAGYIGGALTDILEVSEHNVIVYDALLYEESYLKEIPFVYGDVRDTRKLYQYIEWADVVIWLAALVGDGACELHADVSIDVNSKSVEWLVANFPDKRIIFTSTCSVYGWYNGVANEDTEFNPQSVYAATKIMAEQALEGRNSIIYRLGTLYGVGDTYSRIRLDLVANTMVAKAYRDKEIFVYGDGTQKRPLLHVRDIAMQLFRSIYSAETGVYNLARDNVTMRELAYRLTTVIPGVNIHFTDAPIVDKRSYAASSNKAIEELDFSPSLSLEHGAEELYKLFLEGRIRDLDNPRYTNQIYLSTFNTHLEW